MENLTSKLNPLIETYYRVDTWQEFTVIEKVLPRSLRLHSSKHNNSRHSHALINSVRIIVQAYLLQMWTDAPNMSFSLHTLSTASSYYICQHEEYVFQCIKTILIYSCLAADYVFHIKQFIFTETRKPSVRPILLRSGKNRLVKNLSEKPTKQFAVKNIWH